MKLSMTFLLSLIYFVKVQAFEISTSYIEKRLNCETLGDVPGHITTSMLIRTQQNSTEFFIKEEFFYVTPQFPNAETEETKFNPAVVVLYKNTFRATIVHRDEGLFMFNIIE